MARIVDLHNSDPRSTLPVLYSLSIGARCFVVKPFVVLLARPKVVVK